MDFERGKDIKEQIGVGITNKTLEINYCLFHIKGVQPGRPKLGNPIYSFKLEMKGNIIESTKHMLSLLEINPLPWEKIQEVAFLLTKYDRRKFKQSIKEGRIPCLNLEVGTFYTDGSDQTEGMEYLKYQGEIYPLGESPHIIQISPPKRFIKRLMNIKLRIFFDAFLLLFLVALI